MENIIEHSSFGAMPSKKDYRTVQADQAMAVMPPKAAKVLLDFPSVDDLCNQRKLGVCTKCACRMAEEEYFRDGIRLSEYWGYLMGKVLIDDPANNGVHFEGSSAFTMLKTANKWGTPTRVIETKYPLKVDGTYAEFIADFQAKYGGKIPDEVMADAASHKIPGYYQVNVDPIAIAREISNGRVLIIRMTVGDNFYKAADGSPSWAEKDLLPLRTPKMVDGGHLMALNEYIGLSASQELRGPNSWSRAWAANGYYDFVFNVQAPYYFTEAWAIAELPIAVSNNVKDLPEAQSFRHVFLRNIDRGETGDEVRALQVGLCILGFLDIKVDELGTFGPKTAAAVLKYQKARKLLPDSSLDANGGNYVHRLTVDALNKDLNK